MISVFPNWRRQYAFRITLFSYSINYCTPVKHVVCVNIRGEGDLVLGWGVRIFIACHNQIQFPPLRNAVHSDSGPAAYGCKRFQNCRQWSWNSVYNHSTLSCGSLLRCRLSIAAVLNLYSAVTPCGRLKSCSDPNNRIAWVTLKECIFRRVPPSPHFC